LLSENEAVRRRRAAEAKIQRRNQLFGMRCGVPVASVRAQIVT